MSRSKSSLTTGPTAYAEPSLVAARALNALANGEATKEQQRLALRWIMAGACRAGQEIIVPGQPDVTAYLAGRLSVSLQISWVLGQPAENFRKGEVD